MEKWKKIFRMVGFGILILLTCTGLFSAALMLPRNREKYMNKEVRTEQVDKERKKPGSELIN